MDTSAPTTGGPHAAEPGPARVPVAGEPPARGGGPGWARLGIGVLCALLGFAAVVQVRATRDDDEFLSRARESDLVQILDGLTAGNDRLEQEIAQLEATRQELVSGADSGRAALEEASQRMRTLAILAGTAEARGPGVSVTIVDPSGSISAAVLMSAVQELRDAGAEAIQIDSVSGSVSVRVVASTYFVDRDRGIEVDGVALTPSYRILAIGDPDTLATALAIPGGVVAEVAREGGSAKVTPSDEIAITSLHVNRAPRYARPAPAAGS